MLTLLLLACDGADTIKDDTGGPPPTGAGLFTAGCPVPGEARARMLTSVEEAPWGPEALAGPGDALLLNEHAAFVIQGVDDPDTYYHYGGAPIDAVSVAGCEQAGPELLEEMGFVVGQLDLLDFAASSLHQVRGTSIEVVADGADGGPAVVEVRATDDRFWLVELTLVRDTYENGGRKELGPLFGLDLLIRYTLDPGATALQIDVELGGEPVTDGFLAGALVFPSDETPVHAFATGAVSVGGFGLDVGVPWLAMGGVEGAQVVAMPGANMAYTEVAGVRALLDANQAVAPLEVLGASEPPVVPFLLAVGPTDPASASAGLEPYHPTPLGPEVASPWATVTGEVRDGTGPVAGATVRVYAPGGADGGLRLLDRLVTDAAGRFTARTLDPGEGWSLVAGGAGRDDGPAVDAQPDTPATLSLGEPGTLRMDVTDGAGRAIPARVELTRDDDTRVVLYALPDEELPLPPGTWSAVLTRGYENARVETEVVVPEGGTGTLTAALEPVVDTSGWASVDTHVHAEPSPDSDTRAEDRMRTAVASGLDVMIGTDHEAIVDLSPALDGAGVTEWMAYGLGSEVTATVPEHVNAWPFPVVDDDPRGDPVRWYQLGFPDLYAAIRARGARVVQLNHSRVNRECGILCVLDWDRTSDPPRMDDPAAIGLPEGTEVWSWDFDTFEVQNGLRSPLLDPADPRHTGALVDWLSFHNLGYRVTGTAVTDVHGKQIPGEPRVFVAVPDDTVGVVTADDVADGELAGAAVISSGAFARVAIGAAGPGELAAAPDGRAVLSLRVEALPEIDLADVYVLVDCDLAATTPATDPYGVVKLDTTVDLALTRDAYVVVLGFGIEPMPSGFDNYDPREVPRFLTNPIFVDVDGDGAWTAPGPKACATGVEVGR